jgi:hypothetical protein
MSRSLIISCGLLIYVNPALLFASDRVPKAALFYAFVICWLVSLPIGIMSYFVETRGGTRRIILPGVLLLEWGTLLLLLIWLKLTAGGMIL